MKKALKTLATVVLVDIFYGSMCFMSRKYWDLGTGFGDLMMSVFMIYLWRCAKDCIKESRKEKKRHGNKTADRAA